MEIQEINGRKNAPFSHACLRSPDASFKVLGMQKHQAKTPAFEFFGTRKRRVRIIDQRYLPHRLVVQELKCFDDAVASIRDMQVRGAPLIGVTAAAGMYLASQEAPLKAAAFDAFMQKAARRLKAARPTAVNLAWAADLQLKTLGSAGQAAEKKARLLQAARLIAAEDEACCRQIGEHGLALIKKIARRKKNKPVQIMTHCNAGRLAAVAWGTATAPVYAAQAAGIPIHVWVSETRPRNQGASLTAWELGEAGVPYTLVVDNACGHILQEGLVDLVIVGCDRMARNGDAANKIGTYLKALAARAHRVPFYVALPSSTVDWTLPSGVGKIPIEDRGSREVVAMTGRCGKNKIQEIRLAPGKAAAKNPGFDVTPAALISGIITERGICRPSQIKKIFKDRL